MNRREADDARFEELMAREFPSGLVPADDPSRPAEPGPPSHASEERLSEERPSLPAGPVAAAPPAEASTAEPASGDFRRWTPADEPEEPFTPPPAPPAQRWSSAGITGTALVLLPLVLMVTAAFGVRFPMLVSVLAGLGFFVGVGLLLHRLRQRPPIDGDGAVV